MKRIMLLIISFLTLMLVLPASVSAITDIDAKCIEQAYEIGYDLTKTVENIMNELAQLETGCIYSGMMSPEARCLVWSYDLGIRVTNLMLTSPNSTDLTEYYTGSNLINHKCTNWDLLMGHDGPLMDVYLES